MPLNLHKDEEITIDEFKEYDFDPLEVKPISKKNLVIFFLVDTSGSMSGKKIGTLKVKVREETIQTIDILVERAIRKKEIKDYFYQILKVIY